MTPYYDEDGIVIYHGDCLDVLPEVPHGVSLVVADPPYHGVIADDWDNAWTSDAGFLTWISALLSAVEVTVADNGTAYTFCSSRMAGRIEGVIAQCMAVIANCVWCKGDERNGVAGTGIDVSALRTYWASTNERCIVAEKAINVAYQTADTTARDKSGYWAACEGGKRGVFGDYLVNEFTRAGVTRKEIAALFPSKTGGMTGCVSNWVLGYNIPTAEQYAAMRAYLNRDQRVEYLRQNYEELRQNYEELRQNYEELRQNYEELRRPFNATMVSQWGEIWRFSVPRTERQHPTQKPEALIGQIVGISSRPGDLVLDPCMGSGTTLRVAKDLGRRAIGIEIEERYCEIAAKRLAQRVLPFEAFA